LLTKRALAVALLAAAALEAAPAPKPRLVLTVTVDQFRYDYLTRFDAEYKGGLRRLLDGGAVFTSARYAHYPTVTAVGHSTVATGAFPSTSGIIGNEWYDRASGRSVEATFDPTVQLLGGAGEASSPRRLLVSTVGDELKVATGGSAKVFGISQKARAAILSSGHAADGAFWFDAKAGGFVSSTYYFADLPAWVKDFNAARPIERFRQEWTGRAVPPQTSAGNEMVEGLAEKAVEAESLGGRDVTDLLALSFSANDAVGHEFGPDSPEVRAISLATDRVLDRLFRFLDARIGMDHVLVVLTADHGVAPVPETNAARRMPGGRLPPGLIRAAVQTALSLRYGAGDWISGSSEQAIYLNRRLEMEKGIDPEDAEKTAEQAVLTMPHVFRVYTRARLLRGEAPPDPIGLAVLQSFNLQRSPDLAVMLEPYWMLAARHDPRQRVRLRPAGPDRLHGPRHPLRALPRVCPRQRHRADPGLDPGDRGAERLGGPGAGGDPQVKRPPPPTWGGWGGGLKKERAPAGALPTTRESEEVELLVPRGAVVDRPRCAADHAPDDRALLAADHAAQHRAADRRASDDERAALPGARPTMDLRLVRAAAHGLARDGTTRSGGSGRPRPHRRRIRVYGRRIRLDRRPEVALRRRGVRRRRRQCCGEQGLARGDGVEPRGIDGTRRARVRRRVVRPDGRSHHDQTGQGDCSDTCHHHRLHGSPPHDLRDAAIASIPSIAASVPWQVPLD
jgi:hypothetical protein